MSLVLSPRSSPVPLHSPPPSPDEHDLGGRAPWYHSDDDLEDHRVGATEHSQRSKGKAKLLANGSADELSYRPNSTRSTEAYPPTTDEETDTRRVQENLKRWEMAERQRWRTARNSSTIPTSVLTNVAHRATLLWSRRSSRPPSDGGGKHRVLGTSEDSTHLDGMVSSPLSASQSRSNTPTPDESRTGPYAHTSDPFSDPPPGSTSSLFINAQPITLDIGVITEHEESESATGSSHPTKKSKSKPINAPAPLDLPMPRSPPPPMASPKADRPPEPFPRPKSSMSVYEDEDDTPVRWWTEWLCGCSEGLDRGGEAQAGRTNPLE